MMICTAFTSISTEFENIASRLLSLEIAETETAQEMRISEVKDVLLSRHTSVQTRDLIWARIAGLSRNSGKEWTTVALGLALPGLKNLTRQFGADYPAANREDMAAEVLTAFLDALASVDLTRPGIMTRMYWATYRAARRAAYAEIYEDRAAEAIASAPAPAPGHPDLVLADLVATGILTTADADLISAVRLDGRTLADVATVLGITANAVLLRLRKAELRVAAHITGDPTTSRRAYKLRRKGECGGTSDSSEGSSRTSVIEPPNGAFAVAGDSTEGV